MNKNKIQKSETIVGMTGFGYGKPENFSGYFTSYSYGLIEGSNMKSGYIFDTTSKYIKVPRFYF